ncbi:MAG: hypothetical protein AB7H90_23985 [Alphaproteobacteria bacterium]
MYCLIAEKKLEVIKVDGLGPRVTARSIRQLLGLDGAPEPAPGGEDFVPVAEPPELRHAHLVISRMAARKLWRGDNPYFVLDLARAWNATRGHGALSNAPIVAIVDAACARELSLSGRTFRHAG